MKTYHHEKTAYLFNNALHLATIEEISFMCIHIAAVRTIIERFYQTQPLSTLAREIGVSPSTLRRLLLGHKVTPSTTMKILAHYLEIKKRCQAKSSIVYH